METPNTFQRPRWIRDFGRFLPIKSQFVLSGNVHDLHIIEGEGEALIPVGLVHAIDNDLEKHGYAHTFIFNPVSGFSTSSSSPDKITAAEGVLKELGLTPSHGRAPAGMDLLAEVIEKVTVRQGEPIALIIDFASRLTVRNDSLSKLEHKLFSRALVASHQAQPRPHGDNSQPYYNTIVWVIEKEGDMPDWLMFGNPKIRHIPISKPDYHARKALVSSLLDSMPGAREESIEELNSSAQTFVDETEGMLLVDLKSIIQLGKSENVHVKDIADAVRRYKIGVTEDPWQKIDRQKIKNAGDYIHKRVKGQTHAVTHVLDIIKRAITGVGTGRAGGRPRGVVFLAGPTGVGKTELAKTITSLLFGDENAYIRFDMSEFSAEHSDQRLIGAPPGYVGYDEGGELTNAIREKPFSVVLFDEIEKAHPRILDKFLQILDDGVLTSGRGDRVYFSEAFIVFTSNLGIYKTNQYDERIANVTQEDEYDTVQHKVLEEIDKHFKLILNRPEILNRIGENIIVFDFIRSDIADQIFDHMVEANLRDLVSQGLHVSLSHDVIISLKQACLKDLSNGGRGIRNQIEVHLVNPLARALFDTDAKVGEQYEVYDIEIGEVTSLHIKKTDSPT